MSAARSLNDTGEYARTARPNIRLADPLPESTNVERFRNFLTTTTSRGDLGEAMFDDSQLIRRLRNQTTPVEIVAEVVKRMHREYDLLANTMIKSYLSQEFDAFEQETNGQVGHQIAIGQTAALQTEPTDLARGIAAFIDTADQHHNYEYHDTSLVKAANFGGYLAVREIL
jgi:hypothetical protein